MDVRPSLQAMMRRIPAAMRAQAAALGLDPARLRAEYVLNWGGFVNASFTVTDGVTRVHLKLAQDPESALQLERWRDVHQRLEERYHAPRMLGWVEVTGTPLRGPVFAFINGTAPSALTDALVQALAPLLAGLHGDAELGALLAGSGPQRSCAVAFRETYLRRFTADLDDIAARPPPFVPAERIAWMRREAAALAARVTASAAFAQPAGAPAHGDLWINNLLVDDQGKCWVLDWDDLALCDPAMDWAMLLGPTAADPSPLRMDTLPPQLPAGAAFRERLELYARASLLDWVIDPLADWLEADAAPEHADAVRGEKQRVHLAALERYREFGSMG